MRPVRLPLLRGVLLVIALGAISVLMARGENTAQATTYNPTNVVSVSDPTPGAAADISINFSLDAPDAFPNVKTNSTIQFIPRQWGIHVPETEEEKLARVGAMAGTFNALTTLGIFGVTPCIFPIPVPFTMYDASVDTSNVTSALDIGGGLHPGGFGYSGQFVADPATNQPPADLGLPLINFNADEKHSGDLSWGMAFWAVYRDVDGNNRVSVGDVLLTDVTDALGEVLHSAGSVVAADWGDVGVIMRPFLATEKHVNLDGNARMDPNEAVYRDVDYSGTVTYGDIREFRLALNVPFGSKVADSFLQAGISRYPDFLNQMFPPEVVGQPLARQWGARSVLDTTAVSLNIVTYRPGQLPGYPATMGYPNIVVLLDPVAPIEIISISTTSDLCAPLSLTSTNFGVSRDNSSTLKDESGHVRLTNPKAEKLHDFTLVTTSQPDADDDGIENMLDTCPLTLNTQDQDGRNSGENPWGISPADPDGDSLDGACDPDSANASRMGSYGTPDEDDDAYGNRADNCPLVANGIELLGLAYQRVPGFIFYYAIGGDIIGPDNQADTDGDDIGDACEGSESGPQCANDIDDDGDGVINDGCPPDLGVAGETGDQCANSIDDDGDGFVNDGCPAVTVGGTPEAGDACLNATNDDVDGTSYRGVDRVNDGCPAVGESEFVVGGNLWCWDSIDNDGDGYVNDGCPTDEPYGAENQNQGGGSYGVCSDALDYDADGVVNDGCPQVITPGIPETACDDTTDDDADGIVNDGCPAVDPGDVAKTTITGHMHVETLVQGVPIFKHGVKLNQLGGPKAIKDGGARTYSVDVSNLGSSAEDVRVALRVVEGCAAVSGPSSVSVPADGSATASFTVDFTGCAAGTYTVQADACHAGDAAPSGLFGSGACPGASDGMTDPNPLDDAPIAKSVEVGSP